MPYLVKQYEPNPGGSVYALLDPSTGRTTDIPLRGAVVFGDLPPAMTEGWDGDPKNMRDPHLVVERISEARARELGWVPSPPPPREAPGNPIGRFAFILSGGACPGCGRQLASKEDLDQGRLVIAGASPHPFPGKHSEGVCLAWLTVGAPSVKIPSPAFLRKQASPSGTAADEIGTAIADLGTLREYFLARREGPLAVQLGAALEAAERAIVAAKEALVSDYDVRIARAGVIERTLAMIARTLSEARTRRAVREAEAKEQRERDERFLAAQKEYGEANAPVRRRTKGENP